MREVNLAKASVTAPEDRRGATGRTQALLFLLVFGTNLFFNQGGDWNQNTRLDLTRAIVEGHTF